MVVTAVTAKTCPRCGLDKPLSYFHRDDSRRDGLQPYCRKCKRELGRALAAGRAARPAEVDLTTTKRCCRCGETKALAEFHRNRRTAHGVQTYCKPCMKTVNKAWSEAHPRRRQEISRQAAERRWEKRLLAAAGRRAARDGIAFTITEADVTIPETCPVLGMPLVMGHGRHGPDSASLDKIDPMLGYIPGNVHVISLRANMLKSNATPGELLKLAEWVLQGESPR